MRRCPSCRVACPERAAYCSHCGAILPPLPKAPFWRLEDWWSPRALLHAALGALLILGLRFLCQPLIAQVGGFRSEIQMVLFHGVMGLGLGLVMARSRRDTRFLAWLAAGLLGGAVSWSLDFFYTWDRVIYRGIWYVLEFLAPHPGPRSAQWTYGILQVLRFAGPAFSLALVAGWSLGSGGATLRLWTFTLFALALRFFVRGAYLSPSAILGDVPESIYLYFLSVFLFVYGAMAVDENTAQ